MLGIKRATCHKERGQALVETALGITVVFALLAGMVDFGLAFGHRVALTNASRSGARYASRYPKLSTNIDRTILEALRGTIVLAEDFDDVEGVTEVTEITVVSSADAGIGVEVVCQNGVGQIACTSANRGDQIRVTVTTSYRPIFSGVLGIEDLTIGSSTIMYVLGPDDL